MAYLLDTNVLLDILTDDPERADWSQKELMRARAEGPIPLNPILYA